MLAYMLIVAIAYGVAYGITSTGINLWRAILGFALAFFVAWFGGSLLAVFLIELTQLGDAKNSFLPIIGRGSGWALLGVASRTIIWSLVKQMRVCLIPLFHRLHRRTALER